jgi:hypothetical protein
MKLQDVRIETLWRSASEQCELVFLGLHECRLRFWVKGVLLVNEGVADLTEALRRAGELRLEWPGVERS